VPAVTLLLAAPVAGDGPASAEQSRLMLLALIIVILTWQLTMRAIAHLSGWRSVARRYGAGSAANVEQTSRELLVVFHRVLTFWYFVKAGASTRGIELRLPVAYVGHGAVLLPWTAIRTVVVRTPDEQWVAVTIQGLPDVGVRFRQGPFFEFLHDRAIPHDATGVHGD
jgi:hypothetical protein